MGSLILPRRRFLIGPAIIAASSLMPGHSIAHLLRPKLRKFDFILGNPVPGYLQMLHPNYTPDLSTKYTGSIGILDAPEFPKFVPLTVEEAKVLETTPNLLALNGKFDIIMEGVWAVDPPANDYEYNR